MSRNLKPHQPCPKSSVYTGHRTQSRWSYRDAGTPEWWGSGTTRGWVAPVNGRPERLGFFGGFRVWKQRTAVMKFQKLHFQMFAFLWRFFWNSIIISYLQLISSGLYCPPPKLPSWILHEIYLFADSHDLSRESTGHSSYIHPPRAQEAAGVAWYQADKEHQKKHIQKHRHVVESCWQPLKCPTPKQYEE